MLRHAIRVVSNAVDKMTDFQKSEEGKKLTKWGSHHLSKVINTRENIYGTYREL